MSSTIEEEIFPLGDWWHPAARENKERTMTTENQTETTKTENEPVYVQFVRRLMARADELGVKLTDKNGWQELSGTNGHRICIQKSQTKLPVVETTLAPEECGGEAPKKPNGRIRARMPATPEAVVAALPLLVDPQNTIAPPKRGKGSQAAIPSLDELLAPKQEEAASAE